LARFADIGRAVVVALPVTSCAVADAATPHVSTKPATMRKVLMELDTMFSFCRIIMSRRVVARRPPRTAPLTFVRARRFAARPQIGEPPN
jgi:hypothetical protein